MSTRRQPGRPSSGAREALLRAAEHVFAEQGFAGARIDRIAAVAGFNKSLIFQYFGDKEALYTAVLQQSALVAAEIGGRAFSRLTALHAATVSAAELAQTLTQAFGEIYDLLAARPQLLRMLQWAQAEQWQGPLLVPPPGADAVPQLESLFRQLRRRGLLRTAQPAAVQLTDALLQLQALLSADPLRRKMLQPACTDEERRHNVLTTLVGGLICDFGRPAGSES